ncbi:SUMF1/EgtB/PvdO family nonheme iron enzyme [Pseudoalteromonas luteoviolacea]|uniref:SUMF1/EgtB/PvdO family nonheme iron enzyme n=1 Tax=Pseudoalteromonas luteoviolacea TaxID=43657 RepID=UPI00115089E0|nr:SUMF1/EgtB/PvdO family nonheme iron enzyme [Pseudoalteromonas luteoviolacea]TQF71805.1 formylglycine-generating enzyme family protein [Pseudoalteromonas luteoviolacea]
MSTDAILTQVADETSKAAQELNQVAERVESHITDIKNMAEQSINAVKSNHSAQIEELKTLSSDGYRQAIEDISGGRNTVVIDDQGNPNIMVRIQRFNYEDVNQAIFDLYGVDLKLGTGTPTMFRRNGTELGEVLIAKYLASPSANGGCSVVGGGQPLASVNYDDAKSRCNNKGENWHLMSIHEWSAVALWSLANGTIPRGNTNYGRSHENKLETARRLDDGIPGDASGTAQTYTGKGAVTWSHDHSAWGIQDLVGNVWEWIDQLRLDDGRIITTLDNNPSIAEENWTKHDAYFDSPIDSTSGAGNAGEPILNSTITNRNGPIGDDGAGNPYLSSSHFASIGKSQTFQNVEILRRLLISSESTTTVKGGFWCRNYGNRFPLRGGSWSSGPSAGLGSLEMSNSRSIVSGFRPALFV